MAKREKLKRPIQKDKGGRPVHVPTDEQRRLVQLMSGEVPQRVIAKILGIGLDTLEKYYADELEYGPVVVLSEALVELDRAAKEGNHTAARLMAQRKEIIVASRRGTFGRNLSHDEADEQRALEKTRKQLPKLGKKEQAVLVAQDAEVGTGWENLLADEPVPKKGNGKIH